jgi:DNA-binding transcriptional MerR regulator
VRISELSSETGVPVPTIKYYLREDLLPAGTPTAPNQADYGTEHARRLRLIRVLAEIGNLPISTIREVLRSIDDRDTSMHEVLGVAHHALARRLETSLPPDEVMAAREAVDRFLDDQLGWAVGADAPGRRELAEALTALRSLGWRVDARVFTRYARSADRLAAWELEQTPAGDDRVKTVESVVVGTVVFEVVLDALRRLAQEHHSAARYG